MSNMLYYIPFESNIKDCELFIKSHQSMAENLESLRNSFDGIIKIIDKYKL